MGSVVWSAKVPASAVAKPWRSFAASFSVPKCSPVDNDTTGYIKVTLSYIKLSSSKSFLKYISAIDTMGAFDNSICSSSVGFFPSSTLEATVFGLMYLFIAVAVLLTFFLRRMVKGPTTTPSTETESSQGDEESPPPYSPPEDPNAPPPPPLYPRPGAALFVLATFMLSVQLLATIALAFCIQFLQNCYNPDDDSNHHHHVVSSHVFSWIFYAVFVLYVSSGGVAWVVLLGSLWSPWKKEVMLDIVTIAVFVVIGVPIYLLWQIFTAPFKACFGKKEGQEEGDGKEGLQDEKGDVEGLHSRT